MKSAFFALLALLSFVAFSYQDGETGNGNLPPYDAMFFNYITSSIVALLLLSIGMLV